MLTVLIIFIVIVLVILLASWIVSLVFSQNDYGSVDKMFKELWGAFGGIIRYPLTFLEEVFVKYWERFAKHSEDKLDAYHQKHDKETETNKS